jgi:hypothetical protein
VQTEPFRRKHGPAGSRDVYRFCHTPTCEGVGRWLLQEAPTSLDPQPLPSTLIARFGRHVGRVGEATTWVAGAQGAAEMDERSGPFRFRGKPKISRVAVKCPLEGCGYRARLPCPPHDPDNLPMCPRPGHGETQLVPDT